MTSGSQHGTDPEIQKSEFKVRRSPDTVHGDGDIRPCLGLQRTDVTDDSSTCLHTLQLKVRLSHTDHSQRFTIVTITVLVLSV